VTVKTQVLIVDDEALVRNFVERYLAKYDMEVIGVESADDALERLRDFTPDIFILDIGMPGTDGYELARQIRNVERFSHTPIVFLSGYDVEIDKANSFASGGDLYIRKPISGDVLVQVMDTALNKNCRAMQRVNRSGICPTHSST
jgi:DNA-binding response OmpR family regulator